MTRTARFNHPAVFLDRDGTIVEEGGYIDRIERLSVFPWSVDSVRLLNRAGFRIVVVTNQAGVARGIIGEDTVLELHAYLDGVFEAGGAEIAAWYYCPHHPDGSVPAFTQQCTCRKPGIGMIERAARELDIDLSRSFVIGDRWLDVQLGRATGGGAILLTTGYGASEARVAREGVQPVAICDNLAEATSWILLHPLATVASS